MTDNFNPLVSIVIPVYNGSNYMRDAIDSALSQTYKNIEVLVVNDGSNDGGKTREIALSYGERIRYFEKENGGVSTALNLGIREMKGEYFSWLSHDDVYYSHKIERQIMYLTISFKRNIILYSNYEYIDENGIYIDRNCLDVEDSNNFRIELLKKSPINGCTVLVPKKCFDDVGLFDETLLTTQDYDLWFRLSNSYNFAHMKDILIKSRMHDMQGGNTIREKNIESNDYFIKCIDIMEKELNEIYGKVNIGNIYFEIAFAILKRRYYHASLYIYQKAKENNNEYYSNKKLLEYYKKLIIYKLYYILYCVKDIINKVLKKYKY